MKQQKMIAKQIQKGVKFYYKEVPDLYHDKKTAYDIDVDDNVKELIIPTDLKVKIPHTQGYVACNAHRSGYLKPTQPSRLGLPLALWFVRIQARCHLCSHNNTWKSFRVAAASGHLTGTAYGQAVKP